MDNELNQLYDELTDQVDPRVLLKAVNQSPSIIIITDFYGIICYVNKMFTEVTGYTATEVLGQNPLFLQSTDDNNEFDKIHSTLQQGIEWRGDLLTRKKNGDLFWESASISPILDAQQKITHFLTIKVDITERKQIEEQLEQTVAESTQMAISLEFLNAELKASQAQVVQREKMASIGQLAAGVAHEINNPIGFVSSNLRSLGKHLGKIFNYIKIVEDEINSRAPELESVVLEQKKKLKIDFLIDDCTDIIEESLDGSERVRKIVQNLKTFSRVDQATIQLVDLNECLESTINIVWNEIKYKATLEKDFKELSELKGNPQELTQVFTNILMNASQAIDKDGVIKVSSWQEEDSLFVRIADNGCGISADDQKRIFEPFFTTKPVGEGTGLGMSISYEIVKNHKGTISIESELGKGTTMTLMFPLLVEDSE